MINDKRYTKQSYHRLLACHCWFEQWCWGNQHCNDRHQNQILGYFQLSMI